MASPLVTEQTVPWLANTLHAGDPCEKIMLLNLRPSEVLVLALLTGCAAVEKAPSPSPVLPPAVVSAPAPERVTPADIPAATPFKSEPAPTTTKVVAPAAPRQPVKTADHASVTAPTVVAVTPRAAPIPAAPTAPALPVAALQTLANAATTPLATQQSPPEVTPQTIIKPGYRCGRLGVYQRGDTEGVVALLNDAGSDLESVPVVAEANRIHWLPRVDRR